MHNNLPAQCQGMYTASDIDEFINNSKRRQLEYANEIRALEHMRAQLNRDIDNLRAKINEELDWQAYWGEIVAQWRAKHHSSPTIRKLPQHLHAPTLNWQPSHTTAVLPDVPAKHINTKYKHGRHWSVQKGTPVPPRGYAQRRRSLLERVKLARE